MRLINIFKAAIAASCLAIAACGGSDSTADSQASPATTVPAASILKAAAAGTASLNGTTIPSATQIIDSGGNVWTVSGGIVYENGSLAGYSSSVTRLVYVNNTIYQENAAGGWWSWNGHRWKGSADPLEAASSNGTTIPSATQIIDSSGNVWAVSGGIVYENGALAGYSSGVTQLVYQNNTIYQENAAGGWWSWNSDTWQSSAAPINVASANGTTIPGVTQIIDSSGNVWTVSGGVVYENGALAGYSNAVTQLVYENNTIYQENAAGGWWSWNGRTWASSVDPVSSTAALTIGGNPSTSAFAGQTYSFVPTGPSSSNGTLTFSISNMPAWASFNTANGALTGTPSSAQVGTYANIVIGVSNGSESASLPAFSILVAADTATHAATLSWTAPTENTNGTPLTNLAGYTIYYGTDSTQMTQTIQVPSPSTNTYEISNLSSGTYYFAVSAYSSDGTQSALSSVGTKTVM